MVISYTEKMQQSRGVSEWRVCSTEQSERVELAFMSLMVQTLSEPQLAFLRAAVVVETGEGAFSRGGQATRPWSRMDKRKETQGAAACESQWEGTRCSQEHHLSQRKRPQIHWPQTSPFGLAKHLVAKREGDTELESSKCQPGPPRNWYKARYPSPS